MKEPAPTIEELRAVAAMLPAILSVEGDEIQWGGGERPDGSIQMPYATYSPEVSALISALYQQHVTIAFDWGAWQEEARRFFDADAVAAASLEEVRRLFTLHVRKDRFVEGHFGEMVRCGHMAALLRRLGELVEE